MINLEKTNSTSENIEMQIVVRRGNWCWSLRSAKSIGSLKVLDPQIIHRSFKPRNLSLFLENNVVNDKLDFLVTYADEKDNGDVGS